MSKGIMSILCITALEIVALLLGHDGLLLSGAIAIIAGLGGYSMRGYVTKKDKSNAEKES